MVANDQPSILPTITPSPHPHPQPQPPSSPSRTTKPATNTALPPIYREWRVLPIATLTSIATVIGSGILALPVTLYATPVPIFLFLFTLSMLAQVAVVYAIVELLQRARSSHSTLSTSQQHHQPPSPTTYDSIPSNQQPTQVSLFAIADAYLPNRFLRYIYFFATFLSFISVLVSYGLAGPQAVWQLVSTGAQSLPPPESLFIIYWTLGTFAVVFFVDKLLGIFGSFTVLKGGLFIGVVLIVALLPDSARVASLPSLFEDFSGWSTAATPFLMTCVALGGLANTVPVTFNLLPTNVTQAQVARYRTAIVIAVVLCYLLNVGWVLAVLQVVPRSAQPGFPSLTNAYTKGQISTVPLIDALHNGHAVRGALLHTVEIIVEMFIFVSTGVSFFVTSAGLKNFVDGAASIVPAKFPPFRRGFLSALPRSFAYILSFGSVIVIIVANPDGFIAVLTRFASFTLNLQAGAMLFLMLYNSRKIASSLWGAPGTQIGENAIEAPADPLERGEGTQEEKSQTTSGVPLVMSTWTAMSCIVFGTVFFLSACALAAFGPLFGIQLNAPRE